MQSARESDAEARLSNGSVLAIGGVDNSGTVLASSELYTPATNIWAATGGMASARQLFPVVVLANGDVLAIGGLGPGGAVLSSAELYDPATGTWAPAGSMLVARYAHSATLLKSGKVLVTGGCIASGCTTETAVSELFDPVTKTWTTTGTLLAARAYHDAVPLLDGRVLAVGGWNGAALATSEIFTPATGAWSVAATAGSARYRSAASLLPNGKVLVTGGVITKYPLNSAEIYDPAANTWTPTGKMTAGRYAHSATYLPDGTIMIAGGISKAISCGKACVGFIPTAQTELYNEAAGAFAAAAQLNQPLAYHTATALKSGRALTNGGISTTSVCCSVVADAQFYIPLTLTLSNSSLNFGLLQIGNTSAAQTVTVSNVSAHPAIFTGIVASGDYAQTNTCPATLAAGQQCTISVTFKPTVVGTRNGAVTLADNSPGSPKQTIALTGIGEKLALSFAPASLSMGSVTIGSSAFAVATLTNDGAAQITLSGFAMAPANGIFKLTNACPAVLAAQQTCAVTVTFTPPDVFTYAATLSVTNSAGAPATLRLSGTGLDGP